jgi:hypothetical protein
MFNFVWIFDLHDKVLAISDEVYLDFFQEEIAQMVVKNQHLKLIIFDAKKAEVVKWIE